MTRMDAEDAKPRPSAERITLHRQSQLAFVVRQTTRFIGLMYAASTMMRLCVYDPAKTGIARARILRMSAHRLAGSLNRVE